MAAGHALSSANRTNSRSTTTAQLELMLFAGRMQIRQVISMPYLVGTRSDNKILPLLNNTISTVLNWSLLISPGTVNECFIITDGSTHTIRSSVCFGDTSKIIIDTDGCANQGNSTADGCTDSGGEESPGSKDIFPNCRYVWPFLFVQKNWLSQTEGLKKSLSRILVNICVSATSTSDKISCYFRVQGAHHRRHRL